ncbi:MAG TPA: DUF3488 and transglutaminase-like domain-containing protein, partial [Candidatus Deferrimicrobiaceae bacterium]|nr:DUF3488 and transglutaminase-like domain-containing protein [Candidatus Deferrimicrobiaceae bacterium]
RADGITGFSDTISLRDVTAVKADRRVVARVEFPSMPPGASPLAFHLRGACYSRFDGTAWKRPWGSRQRVPRSGFHYLVSPPPRGAPLYAAEITLEAMDNPALFVYGNPVQLEGSLGEIWEDAAGSLSLSQPGHTALRYRLQYSADPAGGPVDRTPAALQDLEMPPGSDDIRELSARVTAGGTSDAEKAGLALRHFRTGYRYTVTRPASSVREFLFSSRAGFCEHYATALALLLRASGIPARVAAGYLGGEWSDVGKYLIVRQSDAHAWTEARIGGRWVTMDATPPLGEGSPYFARTGTVGMYLDWARQRWNKYVVDYSLKMQAETVSEGWAAFRRARTGILRAFSPGGDFRKPFWLAAILPPAVLLFILVRRMMRPASGRERGALRVKGESRPPRPYARLLRRLADRGRRRSAGTTLEEMLLVAAAEKPPLADGASRFLALYHRDRFGPISLSPTEFREACRLANRLCREISRPGESQP